MHPRSAGAQRTEPREIDYSSAIPEKWDYAEFEYGGRYTYFGGEPVWEEQTGLIGNGEDHLRSQPGVYKAIRYQTDMKTWPEDQQKYALMKRTSTQVVTTELQGKGFTYCEAQYIPLSKRVNVRPDAYTDSVLTQYQGQRLGAPRLPGRGQGCADSPNLFVIQESDPSDVNQRKVGDCWLLSAISALAHFDRAIEKLFRKTEGLESLPAADKFNMYTVTLFDLPAWQEVDIVVDERLCTLPSGQELLGAAPAASGELWVCYLEKAVAAHCGGWDKIDGGQCHHAWRLLTGCREQYCIRQSNDTGFPRFGCWAAAHEDQLRNSPKDSSNYITKVDWPSVGGGGNSDLDMDETFARMCAWQDSNFIMAAGTRGGSDSHDHDGVVDGHSYSILHVVDNAGGSDIDLIQVRNPWGHGEIKCGKWDDDGPGWGEHEEVRDAISDLIGAPAPVQADDGVFWLEKEEFFQYFDTVYLCTLDMSKFCS